MSDSAMNVRLGAKTKEFNSKMAAASKRLKKFGKSVSSLGRSMTTSLTMPLAFAGAASIKLSLDFQKSMTKIQTLVGKTGDEIEVMKAGIMEMSTKTAKSPIELAEGLYFLESAGLRGANAMETLEQVAKGSAAGLGDMEALSVVAAAAQNAYGEETLSASDALDKFGVMVRTGMFDAQELSNVLGKQLGLASNLGVSFDEVGAIISTYTSTTGDATAATNGLSAIMMTFAKLEVGSTAKQAEALDAIGMSAAEVKTMIGEQGLVGTMTHLQSEFDANGIAMGNFFTSSQALKGALGVLGSQSEVLEANLIAMGESSEFVSGAFEQTAETDAFKMEQAMNNLSVAGTQLGDSLAPVIQVISDKIMALTTWWTGLDKSTQDNYASWAIWIATVGPALMLLGGIISKVGMFIGFMKKFQVIQKIATAAQWLFNIAMTANPIGLIIAAIALVIAALVYFATSTSNVAIKVRNFFRYMVNGVIQGINYIIDSVNDWGEYIGVTIPRIKALTMETEKSTEVVEDNADAVSDLGSELNNLPTNVITTVETDVPDLDDGGKSGGSSSKETEKNEEKSLERIRKLKQQFNVLNEKDKYKSDLIALENSRTNALKSVEDTQYSEEEKLAINANFDAKRQKIMDKNDDAVQKSIDNQKSEWESMFEAIEKGWQNSMKVLDQFMGAWSAVQDQKAEKENIELENKQIREDEDYNKWYEGELLKIQNTISNKENQDKAIEALDITAATRREDLDNKQDDATKALQKKAAQREKKMNIFNAIVNTASAVVKALGSAPPPLNFGLAAIVGGLGAAQIAGIASTPIPLAKGGLAFGPTNALIGEYSGAKNNPEVVAPLDKLKSMLGGGGGRSDIALRGELKGNNIFLSTQKTEIDRVRFI